MLTNGFSVTQRCSIVTFNIILVFWHANRRALYVRFADETIDRTCSVRTAHARLLNKHFEMIIHLIVVISPACSPENNWESWHKEDNWFFSWVHRVARIDSGKHHMKWLKVGWWKRWTLHHTKFKLHLVFFGHSLIFWYLRICATQTELFQKLG